MFFKIVGSAGTWERKVAGSESMYADAVRQTDLIVLSSLQVQCTIVGRNTISCRSSETRISTMHKAKS
jgi:hypothetical protein